MILNVRKMLSTAILAAGFVFAGCTTQNNIDVNEKSDITNVQNLTVKDSATINSVTLAWVNPDNKNFDHVSISYTDGTSSPVTVETSASSYTFKNLVSGTSYVFTLVSYDKNKRASTGTSLIVKTPSAVLSSISINSNPSKTTYVEGDKVDMTGFVLNALYSDGKVSEITDYDFSPKILNLAGTQTIKVTYKEFSTSFDVTVTASTQTTKFLFTVTIPEYQDLENLLSFNSAAAAFVATDGFIAYEWYLDGVKIPVSNGFCKITDSMISDSINHTMMVVVTDRNNDRYSTTAEFKLN